MKNKITQVLIVFLPLFFLFLSYPPKLSTGQEAKEKSIEQLKKENEILTNRINEKIQSIELKKEQAPPPSSQKKSSVPIIKKQYVTHTNTVIKYRDKPVENIVFVAKNNVIEYEAKRYKGYLVVNLDSLNNLTLNYDNEEYIDTIDVTPKPPKKRKTLGDFFKNLFKKRNQ